MTVVVTNAQHEAKVNRARLARLARCAVRRLAIRSSGTLLITLIDAATIRALNRRFLRHDRATDVLSFRYDGEPSRLRPRRTQVVGEIFVAPRVARTYARRHHIPYEQELARYLVHGLLHWMGEEDETVRQHTRMRQRENRLLSACGVQGT